MAKIAYIDKSFRADRLELIGCINRIVEDYQAQGYSLTLRQVYYQLVARGIISNNERSYKNLGKLVSEGRLAGLIDWRAIVDRTRNLRQRSKWSDPAEIIDVAARSYHRDWWEGQRYYVEVWVEKDALVDVVGQMCEPLDVPYFSCRGYVSQSELWEAAQRLRRRAGQGKDVVLLHLGDHDPSGKDMSRDIMDRLAAFGVHDLEFHRLALNIDQIKAYNPPPSPTKVSDSRAKSYIERFGHECWELDALEPSVIGELIKLNVMKYRDEEIYQSVKRREDNEKRTLERLSSEYDGIEGHWNAGHEIVWTD